MDSKHIFCFVCTELQKPPEIHAFRLEYLLKRGLLTHFCCSKTHLTQYNARSTKKYVAFKPFLNLIVKNSISVISMIKNVV